MGSSFVVSIVTSFVMLSLAAIGLWSANAVMEDGLSFGTVYGSAMIYLPAMWSMFGLAVLLIGVAPKLRVYVVVLALLIYCCLFGRVTSVSGMDEEFISLWPHSPATCRRNKIHDFIYADNHCSCPSYRRLHGV